MNNTVYADLVCDVLPLELMRERPLSSLILAYHRELKLGEQMDLTLGTLENGGFAAAGHRGGDAIFEANAAFRA